jgi:maleylacetate reductase
MNALAHSVEALYSPSATPLTSMYAQESVTALVAALPDVVREPQNLSHREVALYGAWLAGWALNATTMGLHHKLCHVLGGLELPHAGVHSVLLPHVVAWVSSAAPHVTEQLAARHFAGTEPWLALWQLGRGIDAPTSLSALGYSVDHEDEVVRQVLAHPPESSRIITEEAVRRILVAARSGAEPIAQL